MNHKLAPRTRPGVSWLTRTQVRLELLENRLQPGSLLLGSADIAPRQDAPVPSDTATFEFDSLFRRDESSALVLRPAEDSGEFDSVDVAVVSDTSTNPPRRQPAATASALTSIVAATPMNPAMGVPMAGDNTEIRSGRMPVRHSMLPKPTAVTATVNPVNILQKPSTLVFERHECEGSGAKSLVYSSYEGTAGDDAVLAVATGKDGFIGEAYTAGFSGLFATVKNYDSGGGCGPLILFGAAGDSALEARDIAVNPSGVYVVGTNAPETFAFVARLDLVTLDIIGAPVLLSAPSGGSISLNGVGLGQGPSEPDVFVTGHVFDPSGPAYSTSLVASFDFALAPLYAVTSDFGDASRGLSISADRMGNAFIGDRVGSLQLPLTWRLNAGGGSSPWAFTLEAGGTTVDADNGNHDVKLLGGATAAAGLYTVGSLTDSFINGTWDTHLIAKWNPLDGAVEYGWLWYIPDEDYSGRGNDVDRAGDTYTASYAGTDANRDAALAKFDETGGGLDAFVMHGGAGTQDRGHDLALITRMASSDVVMGGSTTSAGLPGSGGCQPTYNGMLDGFIGRWSQPLS